MKTKQYRVYFGHKFEWQQVVEAECRADAKAQVQSFMKTYDIKGKIKVKGDNRND
jgi:hypothetical protein